MWTVTGSEDAALMLRSALIEHAHDPDPIDWPLRTLLYARDQLRHRLNGSDSLIDWSSPPPPTGSTEWDTLFAAVIAHEFTEAGRSPPDWATARKLSRQWTPSHPIWSQAQVRDRTPDWLKEAGIYMPAQDLETA